MAAKKIHFCGDSVTYGYTKFSDGTTGKTYWVPSDVAGRLLDVRYGVGSSVISNFGVPGSRIDQWHDGDAVIGMPSFATRLSTNVPDVLVLELGLNDAAWASFSLTVFCAKLQSIADQCSAKGVRLVLGITNPSQDGRAANLALIQQSVRDFAKLNNIPIIDYYKAIIDNFPNWMNMLSDQAHPTDACYCMKGSMAACVLYRFMT